MSGSSKRARTVSEPRRTRREAIATGNEKTRRSMCMGVPRVAARESGWSAAGWISAKLFYSLWLVLNGTVSFPRAQSIAKLLEFPDLRQRFLVHISALLPTAIPVHRPLECFFDAQPSLPIQFCSRLARVQAQTMRFMKIPGGVRLPCSAIAPQADKLVRDALHAPWVFVAGAKIVSSGVFRFLCEQLFRKYDVATDRIEHMLPGACGAGTPDQHRLLLLKSSNQVRNQAVFGPVAPSNHIPGARGRDGDGVFSQPFQWKERAPIRCGNQLCAGLAGGVGIVTAERVALAIGPGPFMVLVALVRRDAYHCSYARRFADSFQHVGGSHHVRRISSQRV